MNESAALAARAPVRRSSGAVTNDWRPSGCKHSKQGWSCHRRSAELAPTHLSPLVV